jgi:YD repeat-containing protein
MIVRTIATLCIAGTMLSGCLGMGPGQTVGTLGGAVAGGYIGSAIGGGSTGATIAGALIGGFIGSAIGASLDEEARRRAAQAQYQALEYGQSGQPVSWTDPDGPYGYVTPGPTYQVNAYNCRDYTHTIYIDGQPQVARGTACRNPDGTWTPIT